MKWVEVESTAVSALAYDVSRRRLGVEFQGNRHVYVYHEVPHSEFKAFLAAESKGRYLTLIFLPKNFRCTGPYPSRRRAAYEILKHS